MASENQPAKSALDWDVALEATGGDRGLLQELVDAFLAESRSLMAGIERAIADGDAAELQRLAHSLKGGIRFFGADAPAEAAWRMEQAGRDGDFSAAQKLMADLEGELHKLQAALSAGIPT
ncbi:MAG: Hpt domain-containing protein [Planctomycetes bacterium]|nr:Hpt domain-containing protein [Planctomycetota bacterium]